jgi:hypothetical protein
VCVCVCRAQTCACAAVRACVRAFVDCPVTKPGQRLRRDSLATSHTGRRRWRRVRVVGRVCDSVPAQQGRRLHPSLPHLRRDWARPSRICAGPGARPSHICAGTATSSRGCTDARVVSAQSTRTSAACCNVAQRGVACCSVAPRVAAWRHVLQHVAPHVAPHVATWQHMLRRGASRCNVVGCKRRAGRPHRQRAHPALPRHAVHVYARPPRVRATWHAPNMPRGSISHRIASHRTVPKRRRKMTSCRRGTTTSRK